VEESTMIIAIITNDGGPGNSLFENEGNVKELDWARAAGKFILPVCASDDKQRIGELLSKCADESLRNLLFGTNFIDLHRSHPGYWKVTPLWSSAALWSLPACLPALPACCFLCY